MKVLNDNIKGDTYEKLIEYAFTKCDAILMGFYYRSNPFYDMFNRKNKLLQTNLINKFPNSFIMKKEKYYWPTKENYDYNTYYFKFDENIKKYLLENKDLYSWLNPIYPTDLGFFKDGKCWIITINHENDCYINVTSNEEFNYLKSIGIKFLEPEYEKTPEEYLIFEEY